MFDTSDKILVVDDDQQFLASTCRLLSKNGYDAIGVSSAREAENILKQASVKLILLDQFLPDKHGHELAQELSKNPETGKLPIIVITSQNKKETFLEFSGNERIVGFMLKPFDPDALLLKISKILPKSPSEFPRGSGEKIMIVDDEESFIAAMTKLLEKVGYKPIPCNSAMSVISKALSEKPDVIMLDLKLSGADGISVLRSLRRDPILEKIPVIIVSGSLTHSAIKLAERLNPDGIFAKPIPYPEFFKLVHKLIKKQNGDKKALPPMEALIKRTFDVIIPKLKNRSLTLSDNERILLDFGLDEWKFLTLKTLRLTEGEIRKELCYHSSSVLSHLDWIMRMVADITYSETLDKERHLISKNSDLLAKEMASFTDGHARRRQLKTKLSTALKLSVLSGNQSMEQLALYFGGKRDDEIEQLQNRLCKHAFSLELMHGTRLLEEKNLLRQTRQELEACFTERLNFFETNLGRIGMPEIKDLMSEMVTLDRKTFESLLRIIDLREAIQTARDSIIKTNPSLEKVNVDELTNGVMRLTTDFHRQCWEHIQPEHDVKCRRFLTKELIARFFTRIFDLDPQIRAISLAATRGFPPAVVFPGPGQSFFCQEFHLFVIPMFVEHPATAILNAAASFRIVSDDIFEKAALMGEYSALLPDGVNPRERFKEDYLKWFAGVGRGLSDQLDPKVLRLFMRVLGPDPYEPIPPQDVVFIENTSSIIPPFELQYLSAWKKWNEGSYAEAGELSAQLVKQKPSEPRFLYLHALSQLKANKVDSARQTFKFAADLKTGDIWQVYTEILSQEAEPGF